MKKVELIAVVNRQMRIAIIIAFVALVCMFSPVFLSMSEELGHYVFSSALLFFGIGSGLALAFFWFGGVVGSLD